MKLKTLRDLYVEELKDIYSAEKQILATLPKMIDGAELPELKSAFEDHLGQTKEHVSRLETIFESLDVSPRGKKCRGMEGLLEEGSELLEENDDGSTVLDAGLIGAAQRVEHYEMAAYGCARAHAHELGLDDDAELLQMTLDEEEAADMRLTEIAEQAANARAASGDVASAPGRSFIGADRISARAGGTPARIDRDSALEREDDLNGDEDEEEFDVPAVSRRPATAARPTARTAAKAKGATKSAVTKRANGNRTSVPVAVKRK